MRTVKEVSKLTGVSVRTLHHYDAIGLLKPTKTTEKGYRLYDDTALSRLQSILLFRELQFPLKEIKKILDSPGFDSSKALEQQIELLELQRKHIGELIAFARDIQQKGVSKMEFKAFDKSEIEQYKEEAKEKWGATESYKEFEQKEKSPNSFDEANRRLMQMFAELGKLKHLSPDDKAVQEKVDALRSFITENYYTCTKEIFASLGQMYVGDERFKENIDKAAGEGTAAFAKRAIEVYCGQ